MISWNLTYEYLNFSFANIKTRLIYLLAVCESSSDRDQTEVPFLVPGKHLPAVRMGDTRDICPHLDSIGEVTRDDLLLKSKVQGVLLISSSLFAVVHASACLLFIGNAAYPCTEEAETLFPLLLYLAHGPSSKPLSVPSAAFLTDVLSCSNMPLI